MQLLSAKRYLIYTFFGHKNVKLKWRKKNTLCEQNSNPNRTSNKKLNKEGTKCRYTMAICQPFSWMHLILAGYVSALCIALISCFFLRSLCSFIFPWCCIFFFAFTRVRRCIVCICLRELQRNFYSLLSLFFLFVKLQCRECVCIINVFVKQSPTWLCFVYRF